MPSVILIEGWVLLAIVVYNVIVWCAIVFLIENLRHYSKQVHRVNAQYEAMFEALRMTYEAVQIMQEEASRLSRMSIELGEHLKAHAEGTAKLSQVRLPNAEY